MVQSIDEFDEMMDQWDALMEAGNYGAVLSMLDARLPKPEGIPSLDQLMDWVGSAYSIAATGIRHSVHTNNTIFISSRSLSCALVP